MTYSFLPKFLGQGMAFRIAVSALAGDIRAGEQMAVGRTHDVVERLRQRFS